MIILGYFHQFWGEQHFRGSLCHLQKMNSKLNHQVELVQIHSVVVSKFVWRWKNCRLIGDRFHFMFFCETAKKPTILLQHFWSYEIHFDFEINQEKFVYLRILLMTFDKLASNHLRKQIITSFEIWNKWSKLQMFSIMFELFYFLLSLHFYLYKA